MVGKQMSDPGFSNDWWGRDPIEQAGEPDDHAKKLIRDYEHQTAIIKNQTELLAMMLRGMRQ
jgi:hypothetical protein